MLLCNNGGSALIPLLQHPSHARVLACPSRREAPRKHAASIYISSVRDDNGIARPTSLKASTFILNQALPVPALDAKPNAQP